jgi:hypothetical protein
MYFTNSRFTILAAFECRNEGGLTLDVSFRLKILSLLESPKKPEFFITKRHFPLPPWPLRRARGSRRR